MQLNPQRKFDTHPVQNLSKEKGYRGVVMTCDHPTDRVRNNVLPLFEEASKTIDLQ